MQAAVARIRVQNFVQNNRAACPLGAGPNVRNVIAAAPGPARTREFRVSDHGRSRRSMSVVLRMRLAISSIEQSVVSSNGTPWRANNASAARSS